MRNCCSDAFLFHNAGLGILRRNRRGTPVLSQSAENRLFRDRSSDRGYAEIVCTIDIGPVSFPAGRTRISPAVVRDRFDCGATLISFSQVERVLGVSRRIPQPRWGANRKIAVWIEGYERSRRAEV